MTDQPSHAVPAPAGARAVDDWVDLGGLAPYRYFVGTERIVPRYVFDDVKVGITGCQRPDGRVERHISVSTGVEQALTFLEARELAKTLNEAAAEIEQLNDRDYGPDDDTL